MLTTDATTTQEREIDDLAVRLFAGTYNLTFADSYAAAFYAKLRGSDRCQRALNLVSATACTFLQAAKAVEASDAMVAEDARPTFTAPLRGAHALQECN